MFFTIPRGSEWEERVEAVADPSLAEEDAEQITSLLHQFHALPEFEKRRPAMEICTILARWNSQNPDQRPIRASLQSLWDRIHPFLRTLVVDLFPGEVSVVNDLKAHRFVSFQEVGPEICLVLFHPQSRVTGAGYLPSGFDGVDAIAPLVRAMGSVMPDGWHPEEVRSWVAGGFAGTEDTLLERVSAGLVGSGISSHKLDMHLAKRDRGHSLTHFVFDRISANLVQFMATFDSVHFGLRDQLDRDRGIVARRQGVGELRKVRIG